MCQGMDPVIRRRSCHINSIYILHVGQQYGCSSRTGHGINVLASRRPAGPRMGPSHFDLPAFNTGARPSLIHSFIHQYSLINGKLWRIRNGMLATMMTLPKRPIWNSDVTFVPLCGLVT